jgi:hypothetical protein
MEKKPMKDYYEDKVQQLDTGALTAFGLPIHSRYANAGEIVELIEFASLLNDKKVTHYVKDAFYDSKAGHCTFELDPSVFEGDVVADAIFEAANETLTYFLWFDDNPNYGRSADFNHRSVGRNDTCSGDV